MLVDTKHLSLSPPSLCGFFLFLALCLRRQGDLYLCVFFLGLDLFALATYAGLLVFAVSSKLGHAGAVLACAAGISRTSCSE